MNLFGFMNGGNMFKKFLSLFTREKIMYIGTDLYEVDIRKVPQWWFIWWHYHWYEDGYQHCSPVMYEVTQEERERFINKTQYITDQFNKLRIKNENIKTD